MGILHRITEEELTKIKTDLDRTPSLPEKARILKLLGDRLDESASESTPEHA